MEVTCFYDYTCAYSYRALLWLDAVAGAGEDLDVVWRTFSLKEANREPGTPSPFDDPAITSVSVLALALAHAARDRPGAFAGYHRAVFDAMHGDGDRVDVAELLAIADASGVDTAAFDARQAEAAPLSAVAAEHREAVERFGVFGTPTLVLDGGAVVFVKLASTPAEGTALELWRSLCTLARCHPDLLEIKRPPVR